MHRQEQTLGAGERIGTAAGGAVVLPGPLRRREVGAVENVLRRIPGLHRDGALFRQQQHHAHFEHQRRLIGRRPQHVVERRCAGELAAEGIERLGRSCPVHRRHRLRTAACGDVRDQHCDDRKEAEGGEICRVGKRKPKIGRDEKRVIADRGRYAGKQRRPQAEADGDRNDCGEKNKIDIDASDPAPDQTAERQRHDDRQQRGEIG